MSKLQDFKSRLQSLNNVRNIGLAIFMVFVLAMTWSGVKAVQANYQLQKQISALKQQNTILQLQNENIGLQNQYYSSDEYLDLAARQSLGLAAPGEKVLLIPQNVALKYVDPSINLNSVASAATPTPQSPPRLIKNLEAWRDFLLGRTLLSD